MPLWEEDVQFPDDTNASSGRERGNSTAPRHLFNSAGSAPYVFPTSTDSDDSRPIETLCRDHLSQRRGAHVRYIGPTFWGIVAGKVSFSKSIGYTEVSSIHERKIDRAKKKQK